MAVTFVNATQENQAQYSLAIKYLSKFSGTNEILLETLNRDLKLVFVQDTHSKMQGDTVYWNPTDAFNVITNEGFVRAESPALGLLHEMFHWYKVHVYGDQSWDEYVATQFENEAARVLDEPVRETYRSYYQSHMFTTVNNPTAKAPHGYWQAVDSNGNNVSGAPYNPDAPNVIVIGTSPANGGATGSGGAGGGDGAPSNSGGGGGGGGGGITLPDYTPSPGGGGKGGGYWQLPSFTSPAEPDALETALVDKSTQTDQHSYSNESVVTEHPVTVVGVADHLQLM